VGNLVRPDEDGVVLIFAVTHFVATQAELVPELGLKLEVVLTVKVNDSSLVIGNASIDDFGKFLPLV